MRIYIPLLIAMVGLIVYVYTDRPKIAETGRIVFFCGLPAYLLRGDIV